MHLEPDTPGPGKEVDAAGVVLVQVSEQLVHAFWRPVTEELRIDLSTHTSMCS